ncbi:MAG: hypothetical protein RIC95_05025 [Vicingaceae bacterium]
MIKKVIISILFLMAVAGGVAFYMFNKKVPTLDDAKADYEMTADQLFEAFDSDEKSALEKFEGKVILVKGKIAQIENTDKKFNVILAAENAMMGGVNCSFNQEERGIEAGDQVKIKGRCQGYLMNVVLNNSVLVNE